MSTILVTEESNGPELLKLATMSIQKGNLGAAIVHLKKLLTDKTRHEIATGMLAAIYTEIHLKQRVEECHQDILASGPSNPLMNFQLEVLQFLAHQPPEALNNWETRLEDSDEFLAYFHSARALL